jgi:hypothetical protein
MVRHNVHALPRYGRTSNMTQGRVTSRHGRRTAVMRPTNSGIKGKAAPIWLPQDVGQQKNNLFINELQKFSKT